MGRNRTLVLIGHVGGAMWPAFDAGRTPGPGPARPLGPSCPDPIAEALDADLVMPSDGPPYLPFQQWAMRVEPVIPLPSVHDPSEYGFWHGYRGLSSPETLDLPPPPAAGLSVRVLHRSSLVSTCPVAAFKVRDGSEVASTTCRRAGPISRTGRTGVPVGGIPGPGGLPNRRGVPLLRRRHGFTHRLPDLRVMPITPDDIVRNDTIAQPATAPMGGQRYI